MTATLGPMPNHPAAPLVIDESEREALRALVRARTTEQRTAMRARVVLAAADGMANERIAAEVGVHKMTSCCGGAASPGSASRACHDAPRPGRAPTYGRAEARPGDRPHARAAARRDHPLERPPDGPPHRHQHDDDPAHLGGGGPKPHRVETFKFSTDPALEAKVADVVGLYSTRPTGRSCSRSTRRPRSRPSTAQRRCCPCGRDRWSATPTTTSATGTTSLFAALEVGTGRSRPRPGPATPATTSSPSCGGRAGLSRRRAPRRPRQREPPTRRRRSGPGSRRVLGSPSISHRPRRPG